MTLSMGRREYNLDENIRALELPSWWNQDGIRRCKKKKVVEGLVDFPAQ